MNLRGDKVVQGFLDLANEKLSNHLIELLLKDDTTGLNIIWATDNYKDRGFYPRDCITIDSIGCLSSVEIRTRTMKTKEEKNKRQKQMAEVYTPSWLCNEMNNLNTSEWFGRKDVFNIQMNKGWKTNYDRIEFDKDHKWKDFVKYRVLEITCGEAPFLVSRYDAATGESISVRDRIGLLDRKLRVVSENTTTEEEWLKWVKQAYQSTYGYEYQGDSLLIGRVNLLLTFIEYMQEYWGRDPNGVELNGIACIINKNIWQMNGLTGKLPYGGPKNFYLDEIEEDFSDRYCIIKDWVSKVFVEFFTGKVIKKGNQKTKKNNEDIEEEIVNEKI